MTSRRSGFRRFTRASDPTRLWRQYVVALVLIVIAIIAATEIPLRALSDLDEGAEVINTSGRQRMLSQRILFLSGEVVDHARPEDIRALSDAVDRMDAAQDRLDAVARARVAAGKARAPEDRANETVLEAQVDRFVALARDIVQAVQSTRTDVSQAVLEDRRARLVAIGRDSLLSELDSAVARNEAYAVARLDRAQDLSHLVMALALGLVVLQALLIFWPAHRSIRHAFAERARQARLLQTKNAELEHFTYTASHDLRAPLRGMENLVDWIREDVPEDVRDDAQENFDLLKGRITRMNALLTDMLAFARIGTDQEASEPQALAPLLHEVRNWIEVPMGFRIEIAPDLPTIIAPRSTLEQIFLNLLSNAVKHHDRTDGTVSVTARSEPGHHIIDVTDDGPGIPADYRDYVFEAFNRLKPRDEVEGSGIGLAIVQKLVASLDGTVEVLDRDGGGTVFRLRLPDKADQAR